jgi:hypothetical protein
MKIFKLIVITVAFAGISSCKKATVASLNVSSDDAAAILAGSIASNSYGVSNISVDVSTYADITINNSLPCGSVKSDTVIRQNTAGANATYYYKLIYTRKLTCNTSSMPDNINNTLTYSGNFNNQRVSLINSGSTNFIVAGLTPTATVYSINGEYKSQGAFKLKADTTNRGSANADIMIKNLIINKSTQAIASGTATVIVTGTTVKKGDFTYNGTLNFIGNGMATMMLNGTNYSINLTTGDVNKK